MPSPIEEPIRAPHIASADTRSTDVLIIVGGPRELLMHPRNTLRMKEAMLSMPAGDIYRNVPSWGSLRLFKGLIRRRHIRVGLLETPVQS